MEFETNLENFLNEVSPLLFTCLKLALASDPKTSLETLHLVTNLDDFMQHDSARNLLETHLPAVYKPIEMIARLYVSDSLRYPQQAEYWLDYAHELAV